MQHLEDHPAPVGEGDEPLAVEPLEVTAPRRNEEHPLPRRPREVFSALAPRLGVEPLGERREIASDARGDARGLHRLRGVVDEVDEHTQAGEREEDREQHGEVRNELVAGDRPPSRIARITKMQ